VVIVEPTFPPQTSDLPATEDEVPRVPLEQALTAYSAGAAVFLDVRSADSFATGHIPGAINIPVNEIEVNPTLAGIDRDEWIITYCT
jgi:rhodanese-related sulfurtransferase